jgi:hypothetical protein
MNAYTIKRGNRTISYFNNNKHYIIGFKKSSIARKVIYNIHPEPEIVLFQSENIELVTTEDMKIAFDTQALLFIPKCKGSVLEPLNDGGFHLGIIKYDEFIQYPFTKGLGIIIPYDLIHEDKNEFQFNSQIIHPIPLDFNYSNIIKY